MNAANVAPMICPDCGQSFDSHADYAVHTDADGRPCPGGRSHG